MAGQLKLIKSVETIHRQGFQAPLPGERGWGEVLIGTNCFSFVGQK